MNEADNPLPVYEIGNSAAAIFALNIFLGICHERETDIFFINKLFEGFHIVVADTNNLSIKFLKFFQITLKVSKLASSDGGEYGKIEGQNNMFLSPVIGKGDFPLV